MVCTINIYITYRIYSLNKEKYLIIVDYSVDNYNQGNETKENRELMNKLFSCFSHPLS